MGHSYSFHYNCHTIAPSWNSRSLWHRFIFKPRKYVMQRPTIFIRIKPNTYRLPLDELSLNHRPSLYEPLYIQTFHVFRNKLAYNQNKYNVLSQKEAELNNTTAGRHVATDEWITQALVIQTYLEQHTLGKKEFQCSYNTTFRAHTKLSTIHCLGPEATALHITAPAL